MFLTLTYLCTTTAFPYMHVNVTSNALACEDFLKRYCADGDEVLNDITADLSTYRNNYIGHQNDNRFYRRAEQQFDKLFDHLWYRCWYRALLHLCFSVIHSYLKKLRRLIGVSLHYDMSFSYFSFFLSFLTTHFHSFCIQVPLFQAKRGHFNVLPTWVQCKKLSKNKLNYFNHA